MKDLILHNEDKGFKGLTTEREARDKLQRLGRTCSRQLRELCVEKSRNENNDASTRDSSDAADESNHSRRSNLRKRETTLLATFPRIVVLPYTRAPLYPDSL